MIQRVVNYSIEVNLFSSSGILTTKHRQRFSIIIPPQGVGLTILLNTIEPGIMVLQVKRPRVRNALNWEAMNLFGDRIEQAHAASDLRALILTGSGGAFIAGGDLKELHNFPTEADGAERKRRAHQRERDGETGHQENGERQEHPRWQVFHQPPSSFSRLSPRMVSRLVIPSERP